MRSSACDDKDRLAAWLGRRSIVLIGMMGAGKTHVGRRLAEMLALPFADADEEIERAAGSSVSEIFKVYGEPEFRKGEVRVIRRLLKNGPQVLAVGGGAFMNAETRRGIARSGVSVWLRAELDVLHQRTKRRGGRPMLDTADPKEALRALMEKRDPVYAEADISVDAGAESGDTAARRVTDALLAFGAETAEGAAQ